MSKRRHEPARKHEQAGVAGVGTYADTVPGKGTAKRSHRATMVARADAPEAKKLVAAVSRAPAPIVKSVKTRWTWTPEQRRAERRARCGTPLRPGTPDGEVPNWHKTSGGRSLPLPGDCALARFRRAIKAGAYSRK